MSEIAVAGCTITIKTTGVEALSKTVSTSPSKDVLVKGKGVYFDSIDVILASMSKGSYLCPSGTITIEGTADNILDSSGNKALQKGDSGKDTFTFTDPKTYEVQKIDVEIEISDAGQSDVIAS